MIRYDTLPDVNGEGTLQVVKPNSMLCFPISEIEFARVREQLNRLLVHTLFTHSKRYPALLSYVVEQTLLGNTDQLKERIIGIEVFDRQPDYDPSADPIVRFTASEVRKRLAMYYVDSAHSGELQIDLPIGSYAAVFYPSLILHAPQAPESVQQSAAGIGTTALVQATDGPIAPEPVAPPPPPRQKFTARAGLWTALVGIAGLCIGLSLHTLPIVFGRQHLQVNPLDQFWSSITTAPGIATISICEAGNEDSKESNPDDGINSSASSPQPITVSTHLRNSAHLALADVVTLAHVGGELEARRKPFRIAVPSQTSFSQLREGPAVLIGAFNNLWTMRITQDMRYGFLEGNRADTIIDRRGSVHARWSIPWELPYRELFNDYAIVARVHDSTTGQPVVVAAGLGDAGTESAGEFLSNPNYFAALVKQAPSNWPSMNMEVVIEAAVVDGHPGPPHILAVEFW